MVVRKYTYLIETNLKATLRKTLHDFSVMSWISCQRYSSFLQRVLRTSPGLDKARWLKLARILLDIDIKKILTEYELRRSSLEQK